MMAQDAGQANGRDEIVAYCKEVFGITSWQSVRAWRIKWSFPIRYLPNGKPFLIHGEAQKWAIRFDDLRRKGKRNV